MRGKKRSFVGKYCFQIQDLLETEGIITPSEEVTAEIEKFNDQITLSLCEATPEELNNLREFSLINNFKRLRIFQTDLSDLYEFDLPNFEALELINSGIKHIITNVPQLIIKGNPFRGAKNQNELTITSNQPIEIHISNTSFYSELTICNKSDAYLYLENSSIKRLQIEADDSFDYEAKNCDHIFNREEPFFINMPLVSKKKNLM